MNQLSQRDIGLHVSIVGWLYIVSSALLLVIGGMAFLLLTGVGAFSGDSQAVAVLGVVGVWVALFLTVLALPGFFAGYGLLKRRQWGRVLALVVAFLKLFNVPIGTLLGMYTFWVLLQTSANDYFATPETVPVPA